MLRALCLLCLIATPAAAQTTREQPVLWRVDQGLCEPETVIHDSQHQRLIVSNICGFKRNGKGYLTLLSLDGKILKADWIKGFNAPAGMAIKENYLYVADYDVIRVIDLTRDKVVEVLRPEPAPGALNDIAVDDDWVIYVSDSARHQVLRYAQNKSSVFPPGQQFKYANGLHIDGYHLYVGGEHLWCINLGDQSVTRIHAKGLQDIDGIEPDNGNGLTVSPVGGAVWQLQENQPPVIWTASGVSSANHAYLPEQRLFIVPTGYDNSVIAFRHSVN